MPSLPVNPGRGCPRVPAAPGVRGLGFVRTPVRTRGATILVPGNRWTTRNQRMTERKRLDVDKWLDRLLAASIPFAISALAPLISAKIEADAFNRLTTGPKVTIMDALFLDLRVEAK